MSAKTFTPDELAALAEWPAEWRGPTISPSMAMNTVERLLATIRARDETQRDVLDQWRILALRARLPGDETILARHLAHRLLGVLGAARSPHHDRDSRILLGPTVLSPLLLSWRWTLRYVSKEAAHMALWRAHQRSEKLHQVPVARDGLGPVRLSALLRHPAA